MPRSIKHPTVQAGESYYIRQGDVLLLAYKNPIGARKPVRLLSTLIGADMAQAPVKPGIVLVYNKNMGGVDSSDMMMSFYESKRKTIKVYKRIIIHLIHRVLLNAHVLYKENTTDQPKKTLVQFARDVIKDLSTQHLRENGRRRPQPRQGRQHRLIIIAGTVWLAT